MTGFITTGSQPDLALNLKIQRQERVRYGINPLTENTMKTKTHKIKLRYSIAALFLVISVLGFYLIRYIETITPGINDSKNSIGYLVVKDYLVLLSSVWIDLILFSTISIIGFFLSRHLKWVEAKIAFRFLSLTFIGCMVIFTTFLLVNGINTPVTFN